MKFARELLRKTIATLILTTIIIAELSISGKSVVSYAIDALKTSNENVEILAYFETEDGKKVTEINNEIDKDIKLKIDIRVKNEKGYGGYFDGKVEISNANFKLKNNNNINIHINAGETKTVEEEIEYLDIDRIYDGYLNKESSIVLTGKYVNSKKEYSVEGIAKVKINWLSSDDSKVVFNSEILTNYEYNEKKVLQILLTSSLENNNYPIKNTSIELDIPKNVKEVKVHKRTTQGTNGNKEFNENNYIVDIENNKLNINISNEKDMNWTKKSFDSIVVTYEFDKKENLENTSLVGKAVLTLFDEKQINEITNLLVSNEVDGSVTGEIREEENNIYKGNLYSGKDREYKSTTKINVNYSEEVESIKVKENTNSNIRYIKSIIDKNEFDSIYGNEGYLIIEDQEGNIVTNINKNTKTDNNGNIIIEYGEDIKNIVINTNNPISNGSLNIVNYKKILKLETRQEIEDLKEIKEEIEINGIKENSIINLKEPDLAASISLENEKVSTIAEGKQNLRMMVKLDTTDETKQLYKNPEIKITLPSEITSIEIEQSKALYTNGLKVKNARAYKNEIGENEIYLSFEGEQKEYDTNGGLEIYLYLKVEIDKLTPSKSGNIKLLYTNDYTKENKEATANLQFESQYGLMVYNEIENKSSIDSNEITIKLDANKEQKSIETKTVLVNNYEGEVKDITLKGTLPEKENSTFETEIKKISVNNKNAKIYYSENIDSKPEDKDWSEKVSNPVAYLVEIQSMKPQETIEINTEIEIPEKLGFNEKGNIVEDINYAYMNTKQAKTSNILLKTETQNNIMPDSNKVTHNLAEGVILEISAVSGDKALENGNEIYEGQTIKYFITIKNNSQKDYSNITINATQTNGLMWDLVEKELYNPHYAQYSKEHFYELTDKNSKTVGTINSLEKGKSASFEYEVSATGSDKTFGTISVVSENKDINNQVNTIENKIKNAEVQLLVVDRESRENKWYEGNAANYTFKIKNLVDKKIENVIAKISFSPNLIIEGNSTYFDLGDYKTRIKFGGTEKNNEGETIVTLNISELNKNEIIAFSAVSTIKETDISKDKENATIKLSASANGNNYTSNEFIREFYKAKNNIEASLEVTPKNTVIKNGDTVNFILNISNKENKNVPIELTDYFSDGLIINKGVLIEDNQETDITSSIIDNLLILDKELKANSKIQIKISAKINTDYISDKKLSNTLELIDLEFMRTKTYTVEFETDKVIPESGSGKGSGEEPGSEVDPTPGKTPTPGGTPSQDPINGKYTIEGTVWIDSDENGAKDQNESRLKEITVRVINAKTGNLENVGTKTTDNGNYKLELEKGKYIVIFEYDSEKYYSTAYQVARVSQESNSDAVTRTIKLNGREVTVGATDELTLEGNLSNVDFGLIERKVFDLKLDKYVKQIVVTNSQGTSTYNQNDNQTIAKVEIPTKYLNESKVVIVYSFRIINKGKIDGYASSIVDYLPSSLKFSSNVNPDWYQSGDKIYNASLANTKIKPGESKEITLTVTKTMTSSNTELVNNRAEIEQSKNVLGLVDKTADNASADVLIGVRTGATINYIITTLTIIIAVCGIVYLIYRKLLNKRIKI